MKLLLNPFERIAGAPALALGLAFVLASSFFAALNGIHFDGLFDVHAGGRTGFIVPFAESFFNLILLNVLAIVLCAIFSSSRFRIIDIVGTVTLSRAPLVLASLMGFTEALDQANPPKIILLIVGLAVLCIVVWSVILLFHALRVSANLKGGRIWYVFLLLVVVGEIVSKLLINKLYLVVL